MSDREKQISDENQARLRRAAETGTWEPMMHTIQIDEGQRQQIILALAVLTKRSPGFDYANFQIAERLHGGSMYGVLKKCNEHLRPMDILGVGGKPVASTAMLADANQPSQPTPISDDRWKSAVPPYRPQSSEDLGQH